MLKIIMNCTSCISSSPSMSLSWSLKRRMAISISCKCNSYSNPNLNLAVPDANNNGGQELSRQAYTLYINHHCRHGNVKEALSLLSQMDATSTTPTPLAYSTLIQTLSTLGRTLEAEALLHDMLSFGFNPRTTLFNLLLTAYLRKGLLLPALNLLALMDHHLSVPRNRRTYNILLDYYVRAGRLEDAWSVIAAMKDRGFRLDSFVYGKMICLYRDNGMWKKAVGVLEEVGRLGIPLDKHIYNAAIDTFGKYGQLGEAMRLFERMMKREDGDGVGPHVDTWNTLIGWHCKAGDLDKALHLFGDMQEQGLYPDPKIFLTLISRLGDQGKWDLIKTTFDKMKVSDRQEIGIIYAVLVDIYGQYGRFENAEECISALKSKGLRPSSNVYCVLANAYAQQGSFEQTVKVLQLMEAEGIEPNLIMLNVLINAFGIAGKHLEALSIYHHMKECGICPDVVTYSTLMKAMIRARKFHEVPEIYNEMEKSGCSPDRKARAMLQNALIVLEQKHC